MFACILKKVNRGGMMKASNVGMAVHWMHLHVCRITVRAGYDNRGYKTHKNFGDYCTSYVTDKHLFRNMKPVTGPYADIVCSLSVVKTFLMYDSS